MNSVVLLGAGFSRNWGGWLGIEAFEYLVGVPEIARNGRLKQLLWKHQPSGGFEDALAEVQRDVKRSTHAAELEIFQAAILQMFEMMNSGYAKRPSLEFQTDRSMMVHTFLTKFDAIFSLNQDLLLERHYLNDNVMLADKRRWDGWQIPGMTLQVDSVQPLQPRATGIWVPSGSIASSARHQPLYKLHGSSNWRDKESSSLLIIGGEKAHAIRAHEILSSYASEFQSRLSRPDTRLMIIGYGFRDQHINEVISSAVTRGLKFYLIDPAGSGLARSLNPTRHPGMIQQGSPLEETFETGLIGASRRRLADIFGNDDVEHSKVMQFFDS